MTLKQRALVDILKILALGGLAGALITVVQMFIGVADTLLILGGLGTVYFGYQAYLMRVSQLEAEAERVQRALREGR